jgi:hypothetical protein
MQVKLEIKQKGRQMNDFISAAICLIFLSIVIVVMVRNRQLDERIAKLSSRPDQDLSNEYIKSDSEEHRALVLDAIAKKWGVE